MKLAALLLVPMMCFASDLKIDHVTLAGRDLKTMQAALASAGIPAVYGGAHANSVTEMALASFPDGSYLEAIAVRPGAADDAVAHHEWAAFLKQSGMLCAWAIRSANLAADAARMRQAGVVVGPPVQAGRTRPDGVRLEWQTVNVGAETRGSFFPFLIHDLTARDLRVFLQGKPASREFGGVAYVVVAVPNLDAAIERYRTAFGLGAPARQTDREFGAELAQFPGPAIPPVILARPLAANLWLARRIDEYGPGPCALILSGRASAAAGRSQWFGREIVWLALGIPGVRLGAVR